jgi:excisionase family DNA binding protein
VKIRPAARKGGRGVFICAAKTTTRMVTEEDMEQRPAATTERQQPETGYVCPAVDTQAVHDSDASAQLARAGLDLRARRHRKDVEWAAAEPKNEGCKSSQNNRVKKKIFETDEEPSVLTLRQAAEYLRISKAHLSNVINGKVVGVPPLRHARIGRRILFKREWADRWLESVGQGSPQQW